MPPASLAPYQPTGELSVASYEPFWLNYAVPTVQARRMSDSPLKRAMQDIATRYNGDFTIPLPEVEGEPEFPALSAAIIADAVDSSATRANDTIPSILAPAVDPTAANHLLRARTRRRVWGARWNDSQLPLRLSRAYRQLFGYGTFCLLVVPDMHTGCAKVETRDAMTAYPEPMGPDEVRAPLNVGFVYGRSAAWIRARYPQAIRLIDKYSGAKSDDTWDMLEWIDGERILVGILGKRQPGNSDRRYNSDGSWSWGYGADGPLDQALLLHAGPNRAGMVPGVCPSAVTLDKLVSSLKRIVPITDLLNKISALDFLAGEKAVFPDMFALSDDHGTATIVNGAWEPGSSGRINLLKNVRQVGELNHNTGPATNALMSYLERAARLSSGNTSLQQGELSGSVRSGQTINQLGAFAVDPRIKEAHQIMAYSLEVINEGIAAVEMGWWPNTSYVVFSGWAGDNGHVKYTPSELWPESRQSVVQYPMPGMDVFNAGVALQNAVGARMMSRKTARARHPLIDDSDLEERQITEEVLEDAIQMAAMQAVGGGQMALTDLVAIRKMVREGKSLDEAMLKVQEEAQARQAQQVQVPEDPGLAAAPEAMPGINAPGSGGAAGEMPPGAGGPGGPGAGGQPPMDPAAFLQQMAGQMGGGGMGGPA